MSATGDSFAWPSHTPMFATALTSGQFAGAPGETGGPLGCSKVTAESRIFWPSCFRLLLRFSLSYGIEKDMRYMAFNSASDSPASLGSHF